jgi:diguanylate cyclase (GGDEF)-like protein/PAS domain S-box-containing protein
MRCVWLPRDVETSRFGSLNKTMQKEVRFSRNLWALAGFVAVLGLGFVFYVQAEKRIDRANELRYRSMLLTDELSQSADDLTNMARTYVSTGNPRFLQNYQAILDIRNGTQPLPAAYSHNYWSILQDNEPLPPVSGAQGVALLERLRQAGLSEQEMALLSEAKANSDALTAIERQAMQMVAQAGNDNEQVRAKAMSMLFDRNYLDAKARIMRPIDDFRLLLDKRTADAVTLAQNVATVYRWLFIALGGGLVVMLWATNSMLQRMMGGSVDRIYALIHRIGNGDFSERVELQAWQKDSMLAMLVETLNKLQELELARAQANEALRIAATAFESQDGMYVTDSEYRVLRVNQAFAELSGYSADDMVGKPPPMLSSGARDVELYQQIRDQLRQQGRWQGEILDRRKNGELYPAWLTMTAVHDNTGRISTYVATQVDITQRKQAEDVIKQLAFYDQLTQLPNRRLLLDRLQQQSAAHGRSGKSGALMFIDLDNFKTLNDTLGHDVGDLMLQQVAARLSACVREDDTVARLGGDEFVVMLTNLSASSQEAAAQAEAISKKIIATVTDSYQLAGNDCRISPSIGITLMLQQHGNVDELLKQADIAMYQAKAAGRNTMRFFDPQMQSVINARAALEADMREAVWRRQFVLYYQPQVDEQGRLIGAEALLRWPHPQRGMVSPAEFIPLAEECGLILPIGHWVMETACQQLVAWSGDPVTEHLVLAVNVSARQISLPNFVDEVLALLQHTGANPARLKLELTEGMLLQNTEDVISKMLALKAHGVGFSLDDFGTGYSSLSYLKRLPLDQLKIDQSFVRDVLADANDAAIACTIVALAHSLGLAVIAEGVETPAQRDFLANNGCRLYQGYLFGRPVPAENLLATFCPS